MKRAIIGYTGFVGSNLSSQLSFDAYYHSRNIQEIEGKTFEEIYFCGLPASKWQINKNPKPDLQNICNLISILRKVTVHKFILISTIDIYQNLLNADENTPIVYKNHHDYGVNRRIFENFVRENFEDHYIIRLPGLFGEGLKKNIIFDFLHNNQVDKIDARNQFQFYHLQNLSYDIAITLKNNINLINLVNEPTRVQDVYFSIFGKNFENYLPNPLIKYNIKTLHFEKWGGKNGYIKSKKEVLEEIKLFAN